MFIFITKYNITNWLIRVKHRFIYAHSQIPSIGTLIYTNRFIQQFFPVEIQVFPVQPSAESSVRVSGIPLSYPAKLPFFEKNMLNFCSKYLSKKLSVFSSVKLAKHPISYRAKFCIKRSVKKSLQLLGPKRVFQNYFSVNM